MNECCGLDHGGVVVHLRVIVTVECGAGYRIATVLECC